MTKNTKVKSREELNDDNTENGDDESTPGTSDATDKGLITELSKSQKMLEKVQIELNEKDRMIETLTKETDVLQKETEVLQNKLAGFEKEFKEMKESKLKERVEELAEKEIAIGTTDKKELDNRLEELKALPEKTLEQLEMITDKLYTKNADNPVSNTKHSEELSETKSKYKLIIDGDRFWAEETSARSIEEVIK